MLVLGVTGDVGAGKSTVTRIFAEAGAMVIDADIIAHEIWKRDDVLAKAAERWGEDVILPGGTLNTGRVASIAFSDRTEYNWLCSMLHPLIRSEMEKRISSLDGFVVAEIPLLYENGVPWWIDMTMYVSAPYAKRLKRNRNRGWDEDEIIRRESFLMDREEKISRADIILQNKGDLGSLKEKMLSLSALMKDFASLSEICLTVSSKREALEIYSLLMSEKLVLSAEVCPVTSLSPLSGNGAGEKQNWKLCLLAFQRNFNSILECLDSHPFAVEIPPSLKVHRRPGNILKQYLPEEIRA